MKEQAQQFAAEVGAKVAADLLKKFNKLSENHRDVLDAVIRHKFWATEKCGWLWTTPSYTLATCQSLAKKGFFTVEQYESTVGGVQTHYKFTPIAALQNLDSAEVKTFFEELGKLP